MKYFKNIFIASALVLAATSCVNDDVNYTESVKPIVSITGQSETSVMEGEKITISLTTNTTFKEEMDFKLELVSGGQNADYIVSDSDGVATGATSVDDGFGAFGYKIQIPAYATTISFDITFVEDVLAEGTENLRFKLTSTDNGNGRILNDVQYINVQVSNYVNDKLGLEVNWNNNVQYKTVERNLLATELDDARIDHDEDLCGIVDFDFFLNTFDGYAFTGDCPENIDQNTVNSGTLGNGVLADGTYDVFVDMWDYDLGLDNDDNGTPADPDDDTNEVLDGDFAFPLNVTISHIGTFNTTLDIPDLYFSSNTVSNTNRTTANSGGVAGSGEKLVASIVVLGGKYKVYDRFGDLVAAE